MKDSTKPEPTHTDVIFALRRALIEAARRVSSAEDIRALSELTDSYNASSDWLEVPGPS